MRAKMQVKRIFIGFAVFIAVGIISSFAVYLLLLALRTVYFARELAVERNIYLILLTVPVGLLLSFYTERIFSTIKEHIGGTELIIFSYHKLGGVLSLRDSISRALASAITIGLGGSAGMEGPSFLLGGGVSSSLGDLFSRAGVSRRILLLSGAAAGLTAVLGTPIASAIYSCEVLYRKGAEWRALPATLTSSISSYLSAKYFFHIDWLPHILGSYQLSYSYALHAVVLALIGALVSVFFIGLMRSLRIFSEKLSRKLGPSYKIIYNFLILLIGAFIGFGYFFFPEALGEGKDTIASIILSREHLSNSAIILALLKAVFVSLTLNFGGNGGLFIPQVMIGALVGSFYSHLVGINEGVSALLAISAVLSATSKTPISSSIYAIEMGGPLIAIFSPISSAVAYVLTKFTTIYNVQPKSRKSVNEDLKNIKLNTKF